MINLFVNYFVHKDDRRRKEIDYTLAANIENSSIDNIVILSNDDLPKEAAKSKKVVFYPQKTNPTYHDFFSLTKQYESDVNVIANADIEFDSTIDKANQIDQNIAYCLTRTELHNGHKIPFHLFNKSCPANYSQDAWVFRGAVRQHLINTSDKVLALNVKTNAPEEIDFCMGIPGCDNVIAYYIKSAGYKLKNPAFEIHAIHNHESRTRPDYKYRITGDGSRWGLLTKVELSGL